MVAPLGEKKGEDKHQYQENKQDKYALWPADPLEKDQDFKQNGKCWKAGEAEYRQGGATRLFNCYEKCHPVR
ncbi:hypothetical protein BG74_02755 [Sodalis-like endosymbiont of Proechinophthirus fluctus]|uniref:hypothetical protein n=1 Tax=Sodalis-like endosymbiont of Proechinophthirus fluctus TaxID=1462730 RepID=UPI0007A86657|nr:hypothetical protein [Sodalis-like endosymbiont of Proechinophthirus fluctus]KYP97452.1 hypothetical protein BG74_02755 [Sodalis-like endosymbiont of Proechinophthirus fluctus]